MGFLTILSASPENKQNIGYMYRCRVDLTLKYMYLRSMSLLEIPQGRYLHIIHTVLSILKASFQSVLCSILHSTASSVNVHRHFALD